NGGDGLVLAMLLRRAGIDARVARVGYDAGRKAPPDAAWAWAAAQSAGVPISDELPLPGEFEATDLVVDALLGIGQSRAPAGACADAIRVINATRACVLAVDVPTGLCSDRGATLGDIAVQADATLTLLTPKAGLLTGAGRELAGEIWFDALGCEVGVAAGGQPATRLAGAAQAAAIYAVRRHLANKGSFGDVHVAGGAAGMVGAALLAARAASAAGAGRVLVHAHSSDAGGALPVDVRHPELMLRPAASLLPALREDAETTVVAGCGGGTEVARILPGCLAQAARLVLDADALNAIVHDAKLRHALEQRGRRGMPTVLTPHPLEAARLLGISAAEVQADRLAAGRRLAAETGAIVILKGSGSLVAAPDGDVSINPTGDARLATAGTGDVLAGWLGGSWAAYAKSAGASTTPLETASRVAIAAAYVHGAACEHTPHVRGPLVASELVDAIVRAVEALPG
ncbi:MAG TPA: NAD(P)H-hydrate dehydratase, partial [Burkholderiaceae bacterium]|nr:NAD(P)H-hydrate dehydratase [Burkholderiaceae bacterium]